MLAKQLDDALCSGGTGDWRGRGGKCASCQAPVGTTTATASRANGFGGTESQPMSLLAELEQAEAQATGAQSTPVTVVPPTPPQMVDVDLTAAEDFAGQSDADVERWAARLCDALERQRRLDAGSRPLELSADTRYRLLKLIGSGVADDGTGAGIAGGKPASAADLAELVRNRDGRVAELTCEVRLLSIVRRFPVITFGSAKWLTVEPNID